MLIEDKVDLGFETQKIFQCHIAMGNLEVTDFRFVLINQSSINKFPML